MTYAIWSKHLKWYTFMCNRKIVIIEMQYILETNLVSPTNTTSIGSNGSQPSSCLSPWHHIAHCRTASVNTVTVEWLLLLSTAAFVQKYLSYV